jgi:hypothetical protein
VEEEEDSFGVLVKKDNGFLGSSSTSSSSSSRLRFLICIRELGRRGFRHTSSSNKEDDFFLTTKGKSAQNVEEDDSVGSQGSSTVFSLFVEDAACSRCGDGGFGFRRRRDPRIIWKAMNR